MLPLVAVHSISRSVFNMHPSLYSYNYMTLKQTSKVCPRLNEMWTNSDISFLVKHQECAHETAKILTNFC